MAISREEIKHIAELARIKLTPAEEEKFGKELGAILDYIKKLNKVNTKKVEATAQVSGLNDVWRRDEVRPWPKEEVEAALRQGEIESDQVKVKRVL